ncbi:MAG: pantetheine-phosphate adenylyltransferase [Arsenophonus sp.]|nr:MAG: pantetheine-phosphate adenylyltransferase [Arsenophonus sp.]
MKKKAIYPGTFDPITYGHLDIIKRASLIFDQLIVGVSNNIKKKTMFTLEERVFLIKKVLKSFKNVEIKSFSGLTIQFAKENQSNILIRSIRFSTDLQYEYQLSCMNKVLYYNLETIFFISSPQFSFISSSLIREIIIKKGEIDHFLPKEIIKEILKK